MRLCHLSHPCGSQLATTAPSDHMTASGRTSRRPRTEPDLPHFVRVSAAQENPADFGTHRSQMDTNAEQDLAIYLNSAFRSV